MSGSIARSGVHLAAREVQKCAVHTVDSFLLCDLSRVGNATPRHKHSGRRRRVGTAKSPAAILQQSPVRYLGDKFWEARQGRDARKSAALLFPSTCVTMRDDSRCFTYILPQGQSLCCFIAARFKMRNPRSSCGQRMHVCSVLYQK